MAFKRIYVIVMDSVGIGEEPDAALFNDVGSNTIVHAAESVNGLNVPALEKLGLGELEKIPGVVPVTDHPKSYVAKLREKSNGKDTMTGHWEMMGIWTTKPFQTFTDTGFPESLIDELEKETGHKIIGNKAASGTEILKELGEQQMKENSLIVYTSADSVLQIAASEEVTGLQELYRCCEIARKICMKPEYFVGRVIARPFVGNSSETFKRTSNRHDYTVSPTGITALEILKEHGYDVSAVGKINDIFNGVGITRTVHTKNNDDGMDETIRQAKAKDFIGLCFVNLVDFDSEYGHRRNPVGYARAIEQFDKRLAELLPYIAEDEMVILTADHGNDPTFRGTDHTREKVPFIAYSPRFKKGKKLEERESFSDIGETVLANFNLEKAPTMIGKKIEEILKDE